MAELPFTLIAAYLVKYTTIVEIGLCCMESQQQAVYSRIFK
jgi:hypothetical protein